MSPLVTRRLREVTFSRYSRWERKKGLRVAASEKKNKTPSARLELATCGLEVRHSVQLSYEGTCFQAMENFVAI